MAEICAGDTMSRSRRASGFSVLLPLRASLVGIAMHTPQHTSSHPPSCPPSHPRGLFTPLSAALLAIVVLAGEGDAGATSGTPIEITMLGPSPARVRLALGETFPCDSGDNHRIVDGKFEPGEVIRSSTPDRCVCFQQTYEPFSDIEWSAPSTLCRPQMCSTKGKIRQCVPAPDPTIRLWIRSTRPR